MISLAVAPSSAFAGPLSVSFASGFYLAEEGAGNVVISVALSKSSRKTITVDYTTITNTASETYDFIPTSGTLTFDPGVTIQSFSVTIVDDEEAEDHEFFDVVLTNAVNAKIGSGTSSITIWDDDAPALPIATISQPNNGQTYDSGDTVSMVATGSTVPDGYEIWFAALEKDSGDPMSTGFVGTSLTESFVFGSQQEYVIRLVIAAPSSMPTDSELRGAGLPCVDLPECDSTEIAIRQKPPEDAVISAPLDNAFFDPGQTVNLDASSSVVPAGYDIWFGAMVESSGDPMTLADSGSSLNESFLAGDADAYVIRLVIATPEGMPGDTELRGPGLPCISTFTCDSTQVRIQKMAPSGPVAPYYLEATALSPYSVKLTWVDPDIDEVFVVNRGFNPGALSALELTEEGQTAFFDTEIVPGTTYVYEVANSNGRSAEVPVIVPTTIDTSLSMLPSFDVVWPYPVENYHDTKATMMITLAPEDSNFDPTGCTVELYLDDESDEECSLAGEENDFEPVRGRDDLSCLIAPGELVVSTTITESSGIVLEVPDLDAGLHTFRFKITDTNGVSKERAFIRQVNPNFGSACANFGDFVGSASSSNSGMIGSLRPRLFGYGPVSRFSPDCQDADQPYKITIRARADTSGPNPYYWWLIGTTYTDENGYWEFTPAENLPTFDPGDHSNSIALNIVAKGVTGGTISGRNFVLEDGSLATEYREYDAINSCGDVMRILEATYKKKVDDTPTLDLAGESTTVIVNSVEPVAASRIRFRIIDEGFNLIPSSIAVTNTTVGEGAHAVFMSPNQGWFNASDPTVVGAWWEAEVPFAPGANTILFEALDDGSKNLSETIVYNRIVPEVVADIASPGPGLWNSHALIHLDGTTSVGPPDMESRWVFFYTNNMIAQPSLEVSGLEADIEMPPMYRGVIARLVVATAGNLPGDLYTDELPCTLDGSAGQCDSVEIQLNNACCTSSGCKGEGQFIQVDIVEPSGDGYLPYNMPVSLAAQASGIPGATYAYRWSIAPLDSPDDSVLLHPLGSDGTGLDPANQTIILDPVAEGLGLGSYVVYVEAGFVDTFNPGSCTGSLVEEYTVITLSHELSAVAPGQILSGESLRVYGSTFADGQWIEVLIDDDAIDPPLHAFQAQANAERYLDVTLDGVAPGSYYVAVAEPGGAGQSIWKQALEVEEPTTLISNEEDESCGGPGTECSHMIIPGQTVTGNFNQAGDTDNFYFTAAPGTTFDIVLERVDTSLSPFHPDSVDPELMIADPDGMVDSVNGYANDISANNTDARISSYITTKTGVYLIVCRTSKGYGDYSLTLTRNGTQAGSDFTVVPYGARVVNVVKTAGESSEATLQAIVLDPRGLPAGGATLDWAVQEGSLADSQVFISHASGISQGEFTLDASGSVAMLATFEWPISKRMGVRKEAEFFFPEPGAIAGLVYHDEHRAVRALQLPGAERFKELRAASLRAIIRDVESPSERDAKLLAGCPEIELNRQELKEITLPEGAVSIESLSLDFTEPGGTAITQTVTGLAVTDRKDVNAKLVATCVDEYGGTFDCGMDGAEIFLEVIDIKREYTRGIVTASGVCRNTLITADGEDNAFSFEVGTRAIFTGFDGNHDPRFSDIELVIGATRVKVKDSEGDWVTPSTNTYVDVAPEPGEPMSIHWFQPKDFVSPKKLEQDLLITDVGIGTFYVEGAVFGLFDEFKNLVVGWGKDDTEHHMVPGVDQVSVEPYAGGGTGNWGTAPWQTIYYQYSGSADRYVVRNYITDEGMYLTYDDEDFYYGLSNYRVCVQNSGGGFCDTGSVDNSTADWALFTKPPAVDDEGWSPSYVSRDEFLDEASWHTSPGQPLRYQPSGKPLMVRVEPVVSDDQTQPHEHFISDANPVTTRIWVSGPTGTPGSVRQTREGPDDPFIYPKVDDVEICTGTLTTTVEYIPSDPICVEWTGPVGAVCPGDEDCVCTTWETPPPIPQYGMDGECNTLSTGEATLDTWTDTFDQDPATMVGIPMPAFGITKAPKEPGWYTIVVETTDSRLSTYTAQDRKWASTAFKVEGVSYLDEGFRPITEDYRVESTRHMYVKLDGIVTDPSTQIDLELSQNGSVMDTAPVQVFQFDHGPYGSRLWGRVDLIHQADVVQKSDPSLSLTIPIWKSVARLLFDQQAQDLPEVPYVGEFRYKHFGIGPQVEEKYRRLIIENCPGGNPGCADVEFPNFRQTEDRQLDVRVEVLGWRQELASDLKMYIQIDDPDDPSAVDGDDNDQDDNGGDNDCNEWSFGTNVAIEKTDTTTGRPTLVSITPESNGLADFKFHFMAEDETCGGDNYIVEVQLAESVDALIEDEWEPSGVLTAFKRAFIEIGNSFHAGLFLKANEWSGSTVLNCDWPWVYYTSWVRADVTTVLAEMSCNYPIGSPGPTYECVNKPPIVVFDTAIRPDIQGSGADRAFIDKVHFDGLNNIVKLHLKVQSDEVWIDYQLENSYDGGNQGSDKAAAVGLLAGQDGSNYLAVRYWDEFDPGLMDFIQGLFEDYFVDIQIVNDSLTVYPHFWMWEKAAGGDAMGTPLYRDVWFTSAGEHGYYNIVNLVFDRFYSIAGVFGQTVSHRNVSMIILDAVLSTGDRLSYYDPLSRTLNLDNLTPEKIQALRHTTFHELVHQYRLADQIDSEGGHCNQTELSYEPEEGSYLDMCLMMAADINDPLQSVHPNLRRFCILGSRPGSPDDEVGIRMRDGLFVDTPDWDGGAR